MSLTVLMSAYNESTHIREALDSILNQTYSDFQFLIIDDGSTDGTSEVLDEYEKNDNRVKIIGHEEKKVLGRSLNEGVSLCNTEWIARMDADDIASKDRLKIQMD